tara:strand:- start:336 stop:2072 length:1737 start_codon:yes stop_codon:yes gene_type:complete
MSTQRNILAAILIFGIFMLIPQYMEMVGVIPEEVSIDDAGPQTVSQKEPQTDIYSAVPVDSEKKPLRSLEASEILTIITPLYKAKVSNHGGGSIVYYEIRETKNQTQRYVGSYDSLGVYSKTNNVVLLHDIGYTLDYCTPCLSVKDDGVFKKHNQPFFRKTSLDIVNGVLEVGMGEVKEIYYESDGVKKTLIVNGDSFSINHLFDYDFKGTDEVEVAWTSGVFPSEPSISSSLSYSSDELSYSSAYAYQKESLESITQNSQMDLPAEVFNEKTDWVSIRTKFFGMVMLADKKSNYASLSSKNFLFRGNDDVLPIYSAGMGGYPSRGKLDVKTYLGPLDVDRIDLLGENKSVSSIMNFGWSIIQPFSRAVLWTVKTIHNSLGINYGFVLIIIALLMRVVTGPLTRKSYESSAKMKVVAPLQKKVQEKYKNDPQRLQQEMGKLWKEHGVNPVSGCLPMLIQWPILMSFFIVFRSTIEFRGAPFFGWISDLSQPDYLFALPFEIPLYGGAVAILPILMGISMFLTMKITMQATDDTQKTFMYFMNVFFILIFNSFPSGLTLYYTIFNFLSYQQQLSIKNSK